jgi:integrase
MATFIKRGKTWHAQIKCKGVRESSTFSTKAEAQAWASGRETDIRTSATAGIVFGVKAIDAMSKFAETFASPRDGQRLLNIAKFKINNKELGEYKLVEITPAMLGAWRDQRLEEASEGTVIRDLKTLSSFFNRAVKEWRYIATSPVRDVIRPKEPEPRDRLISQEEILKLCYCLGIDGEIEKTTTLTQRVGIAFLFAIETGMRAGELISLCSEWIEENVIHLPAKVTKNRTKRDVPLSQIALKLLKSLPTPEKNGTIFGLSSSQLDSLFRKAKKKAGIIDLHFHDTRHEAITRLSKKLNVLSLARMVGHKNLNQLQTYYNETAANIAKYL